MQIGKSDDLQESRERSGMMDRSWWCGEESVWDMWGNEDIFLSLVVQGFNAAVFIWSAGIPRVYERSTAGGGHTISIARRTDWDITVRQED